MALATPEINQPLGLQFFWSRRTFDTASGVLILNRWESVEDKDGVKTIFVLDRRVVNDPKALQPNRENGDVCFLCRVTGVVHVDEEQKTCIVAVRPTYWLSPFDAVKEGDAAEALANTFASHPTPSRRPRLRIAAVA